MCSWWLALEWINDAPGFHGVGQFNQYRAWMLDYILRLAEENGIKLILVINNHGKFGMSYDTEWKRNPFNKELGGFLERCEEYFSNAEAKQMFKNLADYMVARWSASPNILFWKLFTEVDLTGPDISYYQRTGDIAAWHHEMGGYLKGIDIYQHPITTHWMLSYHRIDAAISAVPELDLLTTDAYGRLLQRRRNGAAHQSAAWQPRFREGETEADGHHGVRRFVLRGQHEQSCEAGRNRPLDRLLQRNDDSADVLVVRVDRGQRTL